MIADSSLKAESVRTLPPRGGRNHPESVYMARAKSMQGEYFLPMELGQSTWWNILTFVADAPIIWSADLKFHDLTVIPPEFDFQIPVVVQGYPGPLNTVIVADAEYAAGVDPYEELRGRTPTNSVRVHGYLGIFSIPDYALEMDIGGGPVPATAQLRAKLWAQSPCMHGPLLGEQSSTPPVVRYEGIYLAENEYTDAIATAGNRVDIQGTTFQVVGIIAQIPLIP